VNLIFFRKAFNKIAFVLKYTLDKIRGNTNIQGTHQKEARTPADQSQAAPLDEGICQEKPQGSEYL